MDGWASVKNVERLFVVARDFENITQVDDTVKSIQLLSVRGSGFSTFNTQTVMGSDPSVEQSSRILDQMEQGNGRSIVPEVTFRFPGMRSLAIHACYPREGAVLPEPILKALKIFATDRRESGSGPFQLLLRPSPGVEELRWFEANGVTCILTTYRDNEWYVV
jgi:hypothetical protein